MGHSLKTFTIIIQPISFPSSLYSGKYLTEVSYSAQLLITLTFVLVKAHEFRIWSHQPKHESDMDNVNEECRVDATEQLY